MTLETRKEIKSLMAKGHKLEVAMILLNTGRNDWDKLLSPTCDEDPTLNFSISELSEIEDVFNQMTQKACLLSEYIGHRGTYGCGDYGHNEAEMKAEKKLKKVRKAIGYTFP